MPFLIPLTALLPAVLVYAYGAARLRPESGLAAPATALAAGAIFALLGCVPLEFLADKVLDPLPLAPLALVGAKSLFMAGLPEEGVKFLALIWFGLRRVDPRRGRDVLMQSLAVAVGFAALENLAYVAVATPATWPSVALMRGAISVPAHGLFALIMGTFLIRARLEPRTRGRSIALALLLPILLHAAFDFPSLAHAEANAAGWPLPLLAVITLAGGAFALRATGQALRLSAANEAAHGLPSPRLRRRWCRAIPILLILAGTGAMGAGAWLIRTEANSPENTAFVILLGLLPLMLAADLIRAMRRDHRPAARNADVLHEGLSHR